MNEIQRILDAVERHHGPMYLATVVDIAGSSYRRPGAKMLILPGGARVGTISGGCLELDLCRQAAQICKEGPKLITFDTSDDAPDSGRRYNLGCSGIIHVLVEPITQNERCPLRWQQQAFSQRQSHAIGTVYQASTSSIWKPGARLQRQDVLDRGLPKQLVDCYDEVLQTGDATCCHVLSESRGENEWRMLIERVAAPKPIWIFGAGDDAVPLATLAMDLGWDVTLIDDRATTLSRERFPNVHRRLVCGFDQLEGQLSATPNTAAVVMTHDLAKDRCVVRWLFTTAANYVGILGPKSRTGKLLQQLHAAGALPDIDRLDRLRTPVGLDIGASNPDGNCRFDLRRDRCPPTSTVRRSAKQPSRLHPSTCGASIDRSTLASPRLTSWTPQQMSSRTWVRDLGRYGAKVVASSASVISIPGFSRWSIALAS